MRTSVPLRFCLLVLPGWSGMNVFPVFEMGVWVFGPFLHTVPDFVYFWIFGVLEPKGQMGFNFGFFSKIWGFHLVLRVALFSQVFLALGGSWNWVIHLDTSQTTFASFVALGCVLHSSSRVCFG